jgi:hypothetical protein
LSDANGQPDLKVFDTGAVRTKDADGERYDLISPVALEAVARIYAEGAEKYGDHNWEKGFSINDLVKHALRHWRLYASGDRSEDHLAKCIWGFMAAKHSEVCWPHLNQQMRREVDGQLNVPPTVDDVTARSWRNTRENLQRMKADLKAAAENLVAADGAWDPVVALDDFDSRKRRYRSFMGQVEDDRGPVATRFHIMPVPGFNDRAATWRHDLRFDGHEVVSRWIDGESSRQQDESDLHGCDVAIVPGGDPSALYHVDTARRFGKEVVVVGVPVSGFPEHGKRERYFPDWVSFVEFLVTPSVKVAFTY